jgi:hypothetical protein
VDFRRNQAGHAPINNFKFLGVHVSEKLKWSYHMDTTVKKA